MKINVVTASVSPVYGEPYYLQENDLEVVATCPVCLDRTSSDCLGLAEGSSGVGLAVALCRACNHAYLSRRPTIAWYQRYYAEEWDSSRNAVPPASLPARFKARLKAIPALRRAIVLSRRLRGLPDPTVFRSRLLTMLAGIGTAEALDAVPKGRLLEIGSGYGQALTLLQSAGFDAYGTEASGHRAASCRAAGLKVFDSAIDDFGPVTAFAPFDIVYSAHVFEHLTDLQRVMRQLTPLVKPGGVIYIEVPHGPVAENLVHRTHVPVHCHLFSVQSLATLLGRFGFMPVRVLTDVNLHIVAVKTSGAVLPGQQHDDWRDNLVWGQAALRLTGSPVLFEYDHFHAAFSTADGQNLFRRSCPYAIHRIENQETHRLVNQFTFSVEPSDGGNDWPIRFVHPSPWPPVWLKRQ